MTRVLMIVYTRYSLDARVRREAETLARDSRFEVSVLTLKEDLVPRTYISNGVAVKELNLAKYRGEYGLKYASSYLRFSVLAFIKCTNAFFRGEVDIAHVHNMPNFLVFTALLPRIFGGKVILDIHDSVPETFSSKFKKHSKIFFKMLCLEEKLSCAFASKIICVNHVQLENLIQRGLPKDKIVVSMNVPDHKRFDPVILRSYVKKRVGNFKMVYHGTITKRLGIDLAIQAFSSLVGSIPNFEFHIWGDGEFLEECIEISARMNVDNRISFHGTVDFHILPDILKEMNLGIVSNRKSEATEMMLPVKMLEYIALGIPVVVPRLKGIEYYFSDDMVSYFEPEDINSMASAILKLYKDKSLRESQAEKARAFLDLYGWEKHQMDLINLYRELCG